MSYTRNYNESVTGRLHKTYSVRYPASQNGGTTSFTVDESIEVPFTVSVEVDTDPFDNSVHHCNENVNLLTGAVVATETAEVISINQNSKKVANTIIGGFFSYIRSEISQQIAELSQNVDAQLIHLRELAQACIAKKKQMEADFNRISGRYVKIFDDLNQELSNRVYELDKPVFLFRKESDGQKLRTSDTDMISTVAIFGSESSGIHVKISASLAKKRAVDSIYKMKLFLWEQKNLNSTVQQCMLNDNTSQTIFTPVCLIETNGQNNTIERTVYSQDYLSSMNESTIKNRLSEDFIAGSGTWKILPLQDQENIKLYLNSELNNRSTGNDAHSIRVKEMIQSLARLNTINTISI